MVIRLVAFSASGNPTLIGLSLEMRRMLSSMRRQGRYKSHATVRAPCRFASSRQGPPSLRAERRLFGIWRKRGGFRYSPKMSQMGSASVAEKSVLAKFLQLRQVSWFQERFRSTGGFPATEGILRSSTLTALCRIALHVLMAGRLLQQRLAMVSTCYAGLTKRELAQRRARMLLF